MFVGFVVRPSAAKTSPSVLPAAGCNAEMNGLQHQETEEGPGPLLPMDDDDEEVVRASNGRNNSVKKERHKPPSWLRLVDRVVAEGTDPQFRTRLTPVSPRLDSADDAVRSLRDPSRRVYVTLKRTLREASPDWLNEFVRIGGLDVLFDSLQALCERGFSKLIDAYLQLECYLCIGTIMDSRIGLEYIVDNPDYTHKLATALDTSNVTVKKQVFELLSALCAYSSKGHRRALDALEHYKTTKGERYRFKLVVEELRNAQTAEYKTSLVTFINCIIIYTRQSKDRVRVRNKFIGLRLLEIFNQLRKDENSESDLSVQLDVFDDHKYSDDSQVTGPEGVDLSSHLDVFYAILKQVVETPQEIPFLSILQHLLRIDPKEPISDIIWDTAETLVHRATLLESKADSERLLRVPSHHRSLNKLKSTDGRCMCSCHKGDEAGRKRSVQLLWQELQANVPSTGSRTPGVTSPSSVCTSPPIFGKNTFASPPPPPDVPSPPTSRSKGPPPPPPPPPPLTSGLPPPPPPPALPLFGSAPPPPPPPTLLSSATAAVRGQSPQPVPTEHYVRLPQQETPTPKSKMRSLNWNKIPVQRVLGCRNIWSVVAETHEGHPNDTQIDFEEMEGLFCQPSQPQGSPKLGRECARNATSGEGGGGGGGNSGGVGCNGIEMRKKEPTEITLLDGKRSLNVNIFLKQFRSSNEEIIGLIRDGSHGDIGAEKLRGLLKVLPESDEIEMLQSFNGDRHRLGNAEKFLTQLLQVPKYKLRIEGMLLKEEFAANMNYLEPAISAMIYTAEDLKCNKSLQEVLFMVLVAGNFINAGGYAGDAAGFRMTSLQKLTDIRANKPGMNLIHYVAQQAEKKDKQLLLFANDLKYLEDATKTSIDQLKSEITAMDDRVKKLISLVEKSETDIQDQMSSFLKMALGECDNLLKDLVDLERARIELGEFFCEDVQTFKLEECYKIFHTFCVKFKTAVQENERRKIAEEKAEVRRRQREEQLAKKRHGFYGGGEPLQRPRSMSGSESESNIMDSLLSDVRSGFVSRKPGADGSFKIRKVKKTNLEPLNGSSFTSEDEHSSIAGSPRFARRYLPSTSSTGNNGGGDGSHESPDVTPTGTLRLRRRNRLPSEETDENLMDFLRYGSMENEARERRSWGSVDGYGSLDRSIGRRSRRKRPDLMTAEFLENRERPASPAPMSTPSPTSDLPNLDRDSKCRSPWKQKIEAWLQTNEQDSRRKSQERSDQESSSNRNSLQTVPEGQQDSEECTYRPVYGDRWKSPVDNTDVERALEVVEGAQVKDKSAWRKSTLNVPNTTGPVEEEESGGADDRLRNRRLRSRSNIESSQVNSALQSIRGMKAAGNTLQLYFRSPSQDSAMDNAGLPEAVNKILVQKGMDDTESSRRRQSSPEDQTSEGLQTIQESEAERKSEKRRPEQSYYKIPARVTKSDADSTTKGVFEDDAVQYSRTSTGATIIRVDGKAAVKDQGPIGDGQASGSSRASGRFSRTTSSEQDADSENIETPPTPRRVRRVPSTCSDEKSRSAVNRDRTAWSRSSQKSSVSRDDDLGDGQFDRFASTRRTRRFRKNTDGGDGVKKEPDQAESGRKAKTTTLATADQNVRLRHWQEKQNDNVDIDEAFREIQKTGEELKGDIRSHSSAFGESNPRLNERTEEEKVTGDYEKVTSRRSSRTIPSALSTRRMSRPSTLPLSNDGVDHKTFTSTFVLTPTSPDMEINKAVTAESTPPSLEKQQCVGSDTTTNSSTGRASTCIQPVDIRRSFRTRSPSSRAAATSLRSSLRDAPSRSSSISDVKGGGGSSRLISSYCEPDKDEGFEEIQSLTSDSNNSAPQSMSYSTGVNNDIGQMNVAPIQEQAGELSETNKSDTKPLISTAVVSNAVTACARRRSSASSGTTTGLLQRGSPFNSVASLASTPSKKRSSSKSSLRSSRSSLSSAPTVALANGRKPVSSKIPNGTTAIARSSKFDDKPFSAASRRRTSLTPNGRAVTGVSRIPQVKSTVGASVRRNSTERSPTMSRQMSVPSRRTSSTVDKHPLSNITHGTNSAGLHRSESHTGRTTRPQSSPTFSSRIPTHVNRSPSSASSTSSAHKENSSHRGNVSRSPPPPPAPGSVTATSPTARVSAATRPPTKGGFGFMRATTSSQAKRDAPGAKLSAVRARP